MILLLWLLAIAIPASASAQTPRFGITDNSFLVEEAFNQERGIFQNIFVATRSRTGTYDFSFTQEWPVPAERHQLSYTLPASMVDGQASIGDVVLNYRFQVATEKGHPAFSPELSLIVPTSAEHRAIGARSTGVQITLPFSKRAGAVYFHWNAGAAWQREAFDAGLETTSFAGGSAIVAVRPMFHLMFESVVEFTPGESERGKVYRMAPGFRTGWNIGESQIVVGAAVEVTRGQERDTAGLIYLSYELPFRKTR